jgi:hypothetical protein
MFTLIKRVGAAGAAGLLVLGITIDGLAQNFRVGGGGSGGGGGVGAMRPGGPTFSAGGSGMGGLPLGGVITSSPYSGAMMPGAESGGYGGGGYGNYILPDPYGGYLKGAADMTTAQGRYMIMTQEAFAKKEDVRRMQMENRRRIFDEWLYERANTPSLQDELERTAKLELRRSRFDPPKTEVWSGKAMNSLLEDLKRMDRSKVPGGTTPLEESVLKKINLTSGKGGANPGILKEGGKLDWPVALRNTRMGQKGEDLRRTVGTLVKKAIEEAKDRRTDPGTIREIKTSINQMRDLLAKNIDDVDFRQYTAAAGYLNGLNDAVNLLQDPDAADYLNGKYSLSNLKVNTVGEVVKYMADNGLQFAPAVDGDQAAYNALHRALANYDVAGSNATASER